MLQKLSSEFCRDFRTFLRICGLVIEFFDRLGVADLLLNGNFSSTQIYAIRDFNSPETEKYLAQNYESDIARIFQRVAENVKDCQKNIILSNAEYKLLFRFFVIMWYYMVSWHKIEYPFYILIDDVISLKRVRFRLVLAVTRWS